MKRLLSFCFFIMVFSFLANSQTLNLSFPKGGEKFMKNVMAPHNIVWTATGVSNVKIEYSIDNGSNWTVIMASCAANLGFYNWQTPDLLSQECLVKITDVTNSNLSSQSASVFSLVEQQIFYVKWLTSMGLIRAELRGDIVPITSQNFMNLCYKNFYTNLIFHRVINNFMIQDGCPIGDGTGDPDYEFNDEFDIRLRHNSPGVLSMANAGPNTNGSQYFITVASTSHLNDVHSVFGRVIDGMNNVYAISKVPRDANNKPLVDVDIYSITVDEYNPVLNLNPITSTSFIEGDEVEITWESAYNEGLKIDFSSDNGNTWQTVEDSINDDELLYLWTVPSSISINCKIRLTSINHSELSSVNSQPFEIRVKPAKLERLEFYQNVTGSPENPENYFIPGKPFKFKIKVLNDYTETFNQLKATLSSTSEFITINQNQVTFSALNAGLSAWSEQEFEILISETLPSKNEYAFEIVLADNNIVDAPWVSKFTIPLLVKNQFFTVDDNNVPDSNGDGDKIIEPGETVEVKVNLQNKSSQIIYDLYGKLETSNNLIIIWNNIQGIDRIVYDTTSYNNYHPIQPNSLTISPVNDFVLDYGYVVKYKIDFNLILNGYLNDYKGIDWETGGVNIKYKIPISFNAVLQSVEELNSNSNIDFEVFPNPTNNFFTIKISSSQNNFCKKIEILNVDGKIVYQNNISKQTSEIKVDENLNSGVYIIKIIDNKNKYKTKVLIKE